MLREGGAKQLSFHSELYQKIPQKHLLRRINDAIDLKFTRGILAKSYCLHFGRPAKEPEMLLRMLIIKSLYHLSDERLMDDMAVNLAYMWFVGMYPEEDPIHTSLLTKFRTLRLKGLAIDEIIVMLVKQCIEKGIIEPEDGISIDSMHIEANTVKKVPERIMKHLARRIFKEAEVEGKPIPDYTQITDHNEAKATMKAFVEEVITEHAKAAPKATADAKAVLASDLFIEQKGIRSLSDRDARVGNKSKTQQFFGYKDEYIMTHSGLITALTVASGSYVDGQRFSELLERTEQSGLKLNAVCGDKAYFRADILNELLAKGLPAYIPVSASSYRVDEERFTYNKDSDQWYCNRGNETVKVQSKTRKARGTCSTALVYHFGKEGCRNCPDRLACMGKSRLKAKRFEVSANSPLYYAHSQWQKTEEFREGYKKRAKIEPKNGEQKRFHGLNRAYGMGKACVSTQSKLTALAVDLKRIVYLACAQVKIVQ